MSLDYGLQVRTIMASMCIPKTGSITSSKFAQSRPPSASRKLAQLLPPSLHNHSLGVHPYVHSIMVWWKSGARRQTAHHHHSTAPRMPKKEPFWLEERRKRVRGYDGILGHDEPHKMRGSMEAWQGCVGPRSGNERVCIAYNAMMSIYPGVSQVYTPCHRVRLRYPCISVCIFIERLG